MGILKPIIVTGLSLALLAWLFPSISYGNVPTLLLASIVLTLLQKIVKPVLSILFLPITIITLGLFSLFINVIVLWLVIVLVPGFHIDQIQLGSVQLNWIFSLLLVSFALSLIQSLIELIF